MDRYFALVYLTAADEQRDAWVDLERARKAFTGKGMPLNRNGAQAIFDRIHRNGRALSAFCLAYMHEYGLGVEQSDELAGQYFAKSAGAFSDETKQGLSGSINNLGFMYANGRGVEQDYDRAFKYFADAAERGNSAAMMNVGICHLNGWGTEKDEARAFDFFRQAAEAGDPGGAACAAEMMQTGRGTARDPVGALQYLKQASDEGDPPAWFSLGMAYLKGIGVAADHDEGIKWLRLAASEGLASAQAVLAQTILDGHPEPAEAREAVRLLYLAADQGDDMAEFLLARIHAFGGPHVSPNVAQAWATAKRMSERNCALGCRLLGIFYERGLGEPSNQTEAAKWYLAAARLGDPDSQAEMGHRAESGDGVPRNWSEALCWYSLAAENARDGAESKVKRLRMRLKPDEVALAEKMAGERRVASPLTHGLKLDKGFSGP